MSRSLVGILLATALLLTGCATELSPIELETNAQNGMYEVDGAVLHPGTFHLPPGRVITLAQAIRRSGGPWPGDSSNDGGDPSSVHVERIVSGSVVEYTLNALPAGSGESFVVKPGDFIRVPKMAYTSNVPVPVPYSN
jgi:hypothetical protein